MTYIIAEPCVDVLDKACIEECPVDCIYEGNRMLYIHPDECVDCGACEPVCPVEAIFYEDDVPEQWKDYTAANYEFFEDLGSPGRRLQDRQDRARTRRFVAAQPPRGDGALNRHDGRPVVPARLPDFPWDLLDAAAAVAAAHPDGLVDLSMGTPVDPVPEVIRQALAAASDAPGLPADRRHAGAAGGDRRLGRPQLRRRRRRASGCCRRSAPRSWWPGCRRCSASAPATWW